MWPPWKCPWCEKAILRLNVRIAKGRRAWYFSRTVFICPQCERAVRHSKKREAWLLLILPLLIAMIFETSTGYATRIPLLAYVVLALIAVGGVVLFRTTARLEKDDAI
jgi:hypothetical protein